MAWCAQPSPPSECSRNAACYTTTRPPSLRLHGVRPRASRRCMSGLAGPPPSPTAHHTELGARSACRAQIEFDEFIGIMGERILREGAEFDHALSIFFTAGEDDGEPKRVVHENDIREIMSKMGEKPLSKEELDGMLASLQPDEHGYVSREQFREAPFWKIIMPQGEGRKRATGGESGGSRTGGAVSAPPR